MDRLREAEAELLRVFKTSATKHEANERARPIMEQLSRDPSFLTAVMTKYVSTPGSFDRKNYPVVSMDIALNPWFGLVANCWIPLPDRSVEISTKAIHHHGNLLLTTATAYGPGYEHWMFTLPKLVEEGTYGMDLLEAAPHPAHHVAFVDSWTAHIPFYPKSLSITLALWSNSKPTTWRDRAKRFPLFKGREAQLRKIAVKLGLKKHLDIKLVDSFDFYPASDGFKVIPVRSEFELGPNEHHCCSVFHVLQETGNERLARAVRKSLDSHKVTAGRHTVEQLVADLEKGKPIEGKLSSTHFGVPTMNFTRDEVKTALAALDARKSKTNGEANGRKFSAEARSEATSGARAE